MAYTLVQSNSTANSTTGGTVSVTLGTNVTSGNMLFVAVAANTGTTPVVTGNSNTYVSMGTAATDGTAFKLYGLYVASANAGSTTVQSTTGSVYGIYVAEYSGLNSTLNGYAGNSQSSAGTGANVVTSTSVTVTGTSILWGFSMDSSLIGNTGNAVAAGTGFGNFSNVMTPAGVGSFGGVEDMSATASGSATFTAQHSFHNFLTIGASFALASQPLVYLPYSTTQFFVTDQVIQF